jgi:hypothetical protein
MEGQTDLSQVVLALQPIGRLPHFLHGWQGQSHQNSDDGDDH